MTGTESDVAKMYCTAPLIFCLSSHFFISILFSSLLLHNPDESHCSTVHLCHLSLHYFLVLLFYVLF